MWPVSIADVDGFCAFHRTVAEKCHSVERYYTFSPISDTYYIIYGYFMEDCYQI